MDNLIIRNATLEDAKTLEKIGKITKEVTMVDGRTLGLKYFKVVIEYGFVLIAEIDNKIVGFLLSEIYDLTKLSVLTYLVVMPKYRNYKIGTKLMDSYLKELRKRKIKLVSLFAPKSNKKSINFYEKVGFKRDKEYVLFFKDL
ncbi:MAG: GNAT family N-acetyltransferase [Candidatus Aenigmarchaeota archaeon]|nr:GNAT family N-acetyltransferase [Candidatus Aenigmarchaeota archaeon]